MNPKPVPSSKRLTKTRRPSNAELYAQAAQQQELMALRNQSRLTKTDRLLARELMEGKNLKTCWKALGYASYADACYLVASEKFDKYCDKLLKEKQLHDKITYEYKLAVLADIIETTRERDTKNGDKTAISAIAELNKMQGHYAPLSTVALNVNADIDLERAVNAALTLKDY